jgi:hypothetical protein
LPKREYLPRTPNYQPSSYLPRAFKRNYLISLSKQMVMIHVIANNGPTANIINLTKPAPNSSIFMIELMNKTKARRAMHMRKVFPILEIWLNKLVDFFLREKIGNGEELMIG